MVTPPADTIELVRCSVPNCPNKAAGTGHQLSAKGWRSHKFSMHDGPVFYCPACMGPNADWIAAVA